MKLSTSLLKSIAIGITVGAAATSCIKSVDITITEQHQHTELCDESCTIEASNGEKGGIMNCPACGMG